ncbi:hypothetical protein PR202_gb13102 [Eleusine coracana subsp. coracana]|uniref:Serpin domain-containing protein n=1 Tax=Eleusine coracana subsp. coracana TaxID=191504 RepID=A0AAV5ERZ2_ELECO|nr:hypothetical protein PR202_gb13102 [Eleusine coracana subsp. coracana]
MSTRDGQTARPSRFASPGTSRRRKRRVLAAVHPRGDTLAQVLAFLGAPSAKDLADFGRRLADRVLADRPGSSGPRVLFDGGVWVDASRGGLSDEFRRSATRPPTTSSTLSSASATSTPPVMYLVLANTVYFKGAWLEPFQRHSTRQGSFHLNSDHGEVMFMSKLSTLQVTCVDGFKVLKLPYKPGNKVDAEFCMFVFLPDAHDGIVTMTDMITTSPAFLYGTLVGMEKRPVSLMLPRFEISFSWADMKDDL